MKKVLLLYLCIMISFCCWSCESSKMETDNTSQDTVLESTGDNEYPPWATIHIPFDDLDQVRRFIKSANGSVSEFNDYVELTDPTLSSIISHEDAKWIADRIGKHAIIVPSFEIEKENIKSIVYDIQNDYFTISFQKGNALYRFWYDYSTNYVISSPEQDDHSVKIITIGSYNVQLYPSKYNEDNYICSFIHENIAVSIRVISSNFNEISFENFHFEYLE